MRQVHLLDPQLRGIGGHYLSHDEQLIHELQRRQIPVALYGRKGAEVSCRGVRSLPIFSHDIFQEMATDSEVWAIENFHNLNQAFLADLCRIPLDRFGREDLVYFPNLLQNQLYAVALWLTRFPAESRPAVAIMLRYLNHAMDYVQSRKNRDVIALYYRYAARMLKAAQPRSLLCTDTRELAEAYGAITSQHVLELPNPMDMSALLQAGGSPATKDRPVVVYAGHTSALRGIHFLPEIIKRCRDLSPAPRFVIQLQNPESLQGELAAFGAALERLRGHDVELVRGALDQPRYLSLLQQADVILLPYSPGFYGHGSSGVFSEAASAGKVVVVSPDTVPARQSREYNLGVVIASAWTPAAMAEAVARALTDLTSLRARAAEGAPAYRSEHCAATLWDRVFAALPIATAN